MSLPFNLLKSALGRPLNDAATFSDYYLEKGNYLKLDNITVGYTFDLSQLKYVSNARIYATATNLLTITGYTVTTTTVIHKDVSIIFLGNAQAGFLLVTERAVSPIGVLANLLHAFQAGEDGPEAVIYGFIYDFHNSIS